MMNEGMPGQIRRRTMVEVRHVSKTYGQGRSQRRAAATTQALRGVSFTVAEGEFVGIMGPSGSGKSTLLNCLATLDTPSEGTVRIGGVDVAKLAGKQLSRFRRDDLGFVFQDSNLLDTLTAFENIALALTISKTPAREIEARVNALAHQLGIFEVLGKYPYELSGGQRQRVAAARATITHPKLVLADEPTGALDSKSARALLESFTVLNQAGATIVMVTHDSVSASYCERILLLSDGALSGELCRGRQDRSEFYRRIVDTAGELGEAMADAC